MTDRELLELAAKAAGYPPEWHGSIKIETANGTRKWSPLEDDGDALRLAVRLRLVVHVWDNDTEISVAKTLPDGEDPDPAYGEWICESYDSNNDPYAATRRAITRAAAEIGKAMT